MAHRFYINCPLPVGPIRLQGAEAHHIATVSRLHPGDRVCLFNGDGHEYPASIQTVERRAVELEILRVESPNRELATQIQVAAPLPKGDRAQFLIEKLTEMGVAAFVPLETARSVISPREAKLAKLERYVIEASKQCGRNVLLRIEPVAEWRGYCRRDDLPARKILAHSGGANRLPSGEDVALAVGPEGGFTDEEVEYARQAGWHVVDLGPRTLRIETAAILLAAWQVRPGADSP
jgi:16S rRNA (uracil1498-N3)-methyltransferase